MSPKILASFLMLAALAATGCTKSPHSPAAFPAATRVVGVRMAPPSLRAPEAATKRPQGLPAGVAVQAAADAITLAFNTYTDCLEKWNATNDDDVKDMLEVKMVLALDAGLAKAQAAVKDVPDVKAKTIYDVAVKTRVAVKPLRARFDVETDINKKREVIQQLFSAIIPGLQQMLQAAQS
jgi:hypothetical protein